MTTFSVQVFDRAGAAVLLPSDVTLTPQRWTAEAIGGPLAAEIDMVGSPDSMLAIANWLGYQINIVADEVVWWGQIDSVSVTSDGLDREITLDGAANRVKVVYSVRQPGGALTGDETAWSEDATSVADYGKRELVHSASGSLTSTQAAALRTRLLAALADPQKRLRLGRGQVAGRIIGRGYWQRLSDVYYQQSAGLEEFTGSGDAIPLGLGVASAYIGFGGNASVKLIHQVYGRMLNFASYDGLKLLVSGTTSNNGVFTVAGGTKQTAFSYTAETISFEGADDIRDSAGGFSDLSVDDMLWISGAATGSNNGAKMVKTPGPYAIEVSSGWGGGDIVLGAAGPAVTILRGNSIEVDEAVTNERPDGSSSESVTAYGQKVYQTFTLATNVTWTVAKIEIRARRVGSPTDDLRVQLVADNAGVPGSVLESVSISGISWVEPGPIAVVPGAMDWLAFTFSNTVSITYGTIYGILVDRTGAMDALNYYEVEIVTAGGYTRGALKLYDGANYQTNTGDLIFRVLGAQDTATQMEDVISGAGTELSTVLLESTSSISTLQYQEGDETAQAIVEALLDQGTSTGARMLATVLSNRSVRIYTQAAAASRVMTWRGGSLQRAVGGVVPDGWLPVATWVHVDDLALTGPWAGLSPVFVERATYQVGSGLSIDAEFQTPLASAIRGVKQG